MKKKIKLLSLDEFRTAIGLSTPDKISAQKKKRNTLELARKLGLSPARGMQAVMKAELLSAIIEATQKDHLTHAELAKRSGLPRSAVTGMLSGSLQKITIDRVLRLVEAVNLIAEIKIKKAA